MLLRKALGSNAEKLYSDSVFATYLYTGNGSTQTITNGIDLAGKGGLVWLKSRSNAIDNFIFDTARGVNKRLVSDLTNAEATLVNSLTTFNSNGFSLGSDSNNNLNAATYASWAFAKAPKFFDVITYTGNGNANRTISHSLGIKPGFVVIKRTDSSTNGNWIVWARIDNTHVAISQNASTTTFGLNTTNAANATTDYAPSVNAGTTTTFDVYNAVGGDNRNVNESGATYVAYLFAHDTSADGIIQAGSFTSAGSATISLGWEPQWVLIKQTDSTGSWYIADSMRGIPTGSNDQVLLANSSNAESSTGLVDLTSTGFTTGVTGTYIYLAIRRPNKPPTSGAQVYNAIARTGTGAAATVTGVGFPVDLAIIQQRNSGNSPGWQDRLRGANILLESSSTGAESTQTQFITSLASMDGYSLGTNSGVNQASQTYINWCFRRYPCVFDVVAYTGTGASQVISHNLTVPPEWIITKSRSSGTDSWNVQCPLVANAGKLNTTDSFGFSAHWSPISATSITGDGDGVTNGSGKTYVAYLFATLAGISKCSNFTGNGGTQTIDCGFASGCRFLLIKRTDTTGDWYVWDSVRGIVAGNDPHLSLNTTSAEVTTDDSIDPVSNGFVVNQNATTNINVNGGSYIFFAVS